MPTVGSAIRDLRVRSAGDVRRMPIPERLALALRLGERDLESFAATNRLDRATARRLLERRKQATRQPSACLDRLIG